MASSNACFYLVTRWFIKQTFPKRHATRVVTGRFDERAILIRMKAFLIDHSFSRTDKFSLSLGDDATTMGFTLRETEFLKKQFVL